MVEINSLGDGNLDQLNPDERRSWLEARILEQLHFAVTEKTPAILAIMKEAGITLDDIKSLDDFEDRFPVTTKNMFRRYGSNAFLPERYHSSLLSGQKGLTVDQQIHLVMRYTGGTSIRSIADFTNIRYSNSDWLGIALSTARLLAEKNPVFMMPGEVFVNYTWDHIAAPLFSDVLNRHFGVVAHPRPPNLTNEDAFRLMRQAGVNGLVSPPSSYKGKGQGIMDLMVHDDPEHPFLTGDNIKFILTSSTPLTYRIRQALEDMGIDYVKDVGGSTDTGPSTVNCPYDPGRLHIMQGHIYFEVVDDNRHHVSDNEKGRVLVSRIAGQRVVDPVIQGLYDAAVRAERKLAAGKDIAAADRGYLGRFYGADILSQHTDEIISHVKSLYHQSSGIIPNQATQLLRFSGTMNLTNYSAPHQCGCGRYTAKADGLERTYDFDQSPDDIVMKTAAQPSKKSSISLFQITGSDSCSMPEQ